MGKLDTRLKKHCMVLHCK